MQYIILCNSRSTTGILIPVCETSDSSNNELDVTMAPPTAIELCYVLHMLKCYGNKIEIL